MKGIYSYWEDNNKKVNAGFKTNKELALTLTLSVEESKKQFSSVEFYTNTLGKEIVDLYQIPFDKVHVVLDQFTNKLDSNLWAYIKIYVYSLQTSPFIHIDNDVILWDKIPENIINCDLFFQNKECFSTHKQYKELIEIAKKSPTMQNNNILDQNVNFAYNCGVVGANNLSIIKEWKQITDEYLFNDKNKLFWLNILDKHSHNYLFEQYFISALIKKNNLEKSTNTLLKDDFMKSVYRDYKMSHLWGGVKREDKYINKIKTRLYKDYPKYKEVFETSF